MYDNTESISSAINAIGYTHGRANMADALRVLRTQMFNGRNGDRPDAKNVAYLLTDGSTEINRDITLSEADLIIDAGVRFAACFAFCVLFSLFCSTFVLSLYFLF